MTLLDRVIIKYESKKIIKKLNKGRQANNKSIKDIERIIDVCNGNFILKNVMADQIKEMENTILIGKQLDKRINQLIRSLIDKETRFIKTQAAVVKNEQIRFNDHLQAINTKLQYINMLFNGTKGEKYETKRG